MMSTETAAAIDSINVSLNAGGMNTINIILAFVMFGVALGIKPRMFIEVFRKPKSVILGVCCQCILLPLFTFLLALALGIGFAAGSVFKVPGRDRRTLTIETGIQNSGLGLVLLLGTAIFANFPAHGGTLVITAWWGIWHIVSGLTVCGLFRLRDSRKALKG